MIEQGLILLFNKQAFQINEGKKQHHIKNMSIRFIQAIYSQNQMAIRFEKCPNLLIAKECKLKQQSTIISLLLE